MDKEQKEQYQKSVDIAEKIMESIADKPFNEALFALYISIGSLMKENVEEEKIPEIVFMCAEFVLTMCGFDVQRKEASEFIEEFMEEDDKEKGTVH